MIDTEDLSSSCSVALISYLNVENSYMYEF